MYGAAAGSQEILKMIISAPSGRTKDLVDAQDEAGRTALSHAAMNGHMKCAKVCAGPVRLTQIGATT